MADLSSVGFSGNDGEVDLEPLGKRLRETIDAELQRDIRAGEYMVSPHAKFGKPPRQTFVIQLQEDENGMRTAQAFSCISEALAFLNS